MCVRAVSTEGSCPFFPLDGIHHPTENKSANTCDTYCVYVCAAVAGGFPMKTDKRQCTKSRRFNFFFFLVFKWQNIVSNAFRMLTIKQETGARMLCSTFLFFCIATHLSSLHSFVQRFLCFSTSIEPCVCVCRALYSVYGVHTRRVSVRRKMDKILANGKMRQKSFASNWFVTTRH